MFGHEYWQIMKEAAQGQSKWQEILDIKLDVANRVMDYSDHEPNRMLFLGFSPLVQDYARTHDCSVVCDQDTLDLFDIKGVSRYDDIRDVKGTYDTVLGLDEYMTFARTEQEQKDILADVRARTAGLLITSLQDYKNSAPHKKNHIDPTVIQADHNYVMFEHTIADRFDRQAWTTWWHCVKDHGELITHGPLSRRTMYFKQLAKYSHDLGAKEYVVQKNLLYKGFFKRSFEHLITVRF